MKHIEHEHLIIEGFKRKDEKAFEQIYKSAYSTMVSFSRFVFENDAEAEDAITSAFIKLWDKNNDFDSIEAIKGFLYTAIKNAAFNYHKHVRMATLHNKIILAKSEQWDDFTEANLIKANLMHFVLQEIEKLPDARAKIFKLLFLDDLSTGEVADRLNISMDTVRVQKARALTTLRKNLADILGINDRKKSFS